MICVVILGITAMGLRPVTRYMRVTMAKEPIPLRAPLAKLDKSRLGTYRFARARTLDSAVVNSLGTEEYIDWMLVDTSVSRDNPLHYAHLFVTYYTGEPDAVPHTPDHCYQGSGYTTDRARNTTLHIKTLEDAPDVPVRVLSFVKSGIFDGDKIPVLYTFHCNGRFVATAAGVRSAANNPRDKYAYFSKVEVNFGRESDANRYPSWDDALAASKRLLERVLPLLVNEHWPDWKAVKAAETTEAENS